jgi:hypothetical protein
MNNPDESYKNNSIAYQLSEDPTHKRLQINNVKEDQFSKPYQIAREYFIHVYTYEYLHKQFYFTKESTLIICLITDVYFSFQRLSSTRYLL